MDKNMIEVQNLMIGLGVRSEHAETVSIALELFKKCLRYRAPIYRMVLVDCDMLGQEGLRLVKELKSLMGMLVA